MSMIRRDESGFTLIELVVAASIGTIIMLAALAALELGVKQTAKVTDREVSLQRGRVAMTQIVSELRSQICGPSGQNPVVYGDQTTLRFFTYNLDPTANATDPELHEIAYNATPRTITDKMWPGTSGPPAAPTKTKTVLTDVDPSTGSQIFTYYPFYQHANGVWDTDAPSGLPLPLTTADAKRTARIAVSFKANSTAKGATVPTNLTEDVVTRLADPNADAGPAPPTCT